MTISTLDCCANCDVSWPEHTTFLFACTRIRDPRMNRMCSSAEDVYIFIHSPVKCPCFEQCWLNSPAVPNSAKRTFKKCRVEHHFEKLGRDTRRENTKKKKRSKALVCVVVSLASTPKCGSSPALVCWIISSLQYNYFGRNEVCCVLVFPHPTRKTWLTFAQVEVGIVQTPRQHQRRYVKLNGILCCTFNHGPE